MGLGIFDKILGVFKPLEDQAFKYYDNDYMIFAVIGLTMILIIGLIYFLFKFFLGVFT